MEAVAKQDLQEGEVLFKIDKYALTSNNITYAVVGDRMKYWDFFPAEDPWGCIPVWGFADVTASKNANIPEGTRCYGYFPMSDFLKVEAGRINPFGFTDTSAHRQQMAAIYNFYTFTDKDPGYRKGAGRLSAYYQATICNLLFELSFCKGKCLFRGRAGGSH